MLARMVTFQLKPGATDDLIRVFQDVLAPLAAQQPGCHGVTLLTDAQIDRAITIGLWATEADLLAAEQEQLAGIDILLAEPTARAVYEVSLQVVLTEQGQAHIRGI